MSNAAHLCREAQPEHVGQGRAEAEAEAAAHIPLTLDVEMEPVTCIAPVARRLDRLECLFFRINRWSNSTTKAAGNSEPAALNAMIIKGPSTETKSKR